MHIAGVPPIQRYGALSIGLHWLMVLLIAVIYACAELQDSAPEGSALADALESWHFALGFAVLALVVLRLLGRLASRVPPIEPAPPRWQAWLARLTHLGLYALMIGMPLTGWLTLSAEGSPIVLFGLQLPPLVGEGEDFAEWTEELHEAGGTIGYLLIAVHAAAALFHHYVVRDDTLLRMLPLLRKQAPRQP